uniref:Uncharacterized protein n=1 Tax=Rangifer tarandus platyrhynchus TaxID=3082113 RepID=A0ACB0FKH6_RANTA|nr:unnamed protein product [Rangifer tarandus platyrhynchus]
MVRRAPRRARSRAGSQSDLRFHRTCGGRDKSRKNRGGPAAVSPLFADRAPHPRLYSCRGSPLPLERARAPQPGAQGSRYAGWPPPSSPPLSPSASLDTRPPLFHELCLLLQLRSLGQEHSFCPRFVRQLTGGSAHQLPLTLSWGLGSQEGERRPRPGAGREGRLGTGCTTPRPQGEDSEVGDVAGDAAAGGKEVGGWAGWTDAAVMSATGRRRWPAQCERHPPGLALPTRFPDFTTGAGAESCTGGAETQAQDWSVAVPVHTPISSWYRASWGQDGRQSQMLVPAGLLYIWKGNRMEAGLDQVSVQMTIPVKGDFPWLPRPHWTPKLSSSPRKSPWLGSWVPARVSGEEKFPGLALDSGPRGQPWRGSRSHPARALDGKPRCQGLAGPNPDSRHPAQPLPLGVTPPSGQRRSGFAPGERSPPRLCPSSALAGSDLLWGAFCPSEPSPKAIFWWGTPEIPLARKAKGSWERWTRQEALEEVGSGVGGWEQVGLGSRQASAPTLGPSGSKAVESLPRLTMAPVSARREGRGAIVLRDTFPPGWLRAVPGLGHLALGCCGHLREVCARTCVCVCCWRVSVCTEGHVRPTPSLSVHMHALHAGALCLSRPVARCVYQRASWVYLQRGVYLPADVSLARVPDAAPVKDPRSELRLARRGAQCAQTCAVNGSSAPPPGGRIEKRFHSGTLLRRERTPSDACRSAVDLAGARPAQKPPDVSRPARPLMGRKWAGALGTDEPARHALRRHSQGDAAITHPLLTELALAQLVPAKRLLGCSGSEWGDPGRVPEQPQVERRNNAKSRKMKEDRLFGTSRGAKGHAVNKVGNRGPFEVGKRPAGRLELTTCGPHLAAGVFYTTSYTVQEDGISRERLVESLLGAKPCCLLSAGAASSGPSSHPEAEALLPSPAQMQTRGGSWLQHLPSGTDEAGPRAVSYGPGVRLKGRKRRVNCSPRPLGQVAAKHRCPVSGQRRPGGETRSPRLQGRAGAGDGKVRLPLPARQRPWPPARPRLTSGSDQGHNVLAWGQGLAAGRRPGGGAVRGRQATGE